MLCVCVCVCVCRWNKHIKDRQVVAVGCGLKHTLLLLQEGCVLSCGDNEKGQLGQRESLTRPGECRGEGRVWVKVNALGTIYKRKQTFAISISEIDTLEK